MPGTILDRIVAAKREEVARAKQACPLPQLRSQAADAPPARDFFAAVSRPGRIRLIAEIKKASPSQGVIRADFDPVEIAVIYQRHGADCLSVLTEEGFFGGKLGDLSDVRRAVELPVLRKDFIIDSYQVYEARAVGADAVLLIAECLDGVRLNDLHAEIVGMGMTPLVELYDPRNLDMVLDSGAKLIGINNRDLRTFQTDLAHTETLRRQIPADRVVVGESGIHSRDDVLRLEAAGVNAMLVGESLMSSLDIGQAVDRLLGK